MRQQWEGRGVSNGGLRRLIWAVINHLQEYNRPEHVGPDGASLVNGWRRSEEMSGSAVIVRGDKTHIELSPFIPLESRLTKR